MTDVLPPRKRFKARETSSLKIPSPENSEIINPVVATSGEDSFPRDLLVEILSKLPIKSLCRFKAVSKPWKLLMNSPVFVNVHLHRKNPELGEWLGPLNHDGEGVPFPPLLMSQPPIVGNCNGLICLNKSAYCLKIQPESLVLYNPSIRESTFIPTEYSWDFSTPGTIYCTSFGFFYLSETQEYKLFSFIKKTDKTLDMKILTLGIYTKSFRVVKNISLPGYIDHSNHASFGTNMFWLGFDEYMICYDVIEDRFSKMNGPPSSSTSKLKRSLGVMKNSLSMLLYPSDDIVLSFDIWMLITDDVSMDKSWMKYRTVGRIHGPYESSLLLYPGTSSWSDGLINCRYSHKWLSHDLETNEREDYLETAPSKHRLVKYKESLVSVKTMLD